MGNVRCPAGSMATPLTNTFDDLTPEKFKSMKTKNKKRIKIVCITLLLLMALWSLFYQFGIPDKRFVQSDSANESKRRKAFIAEYIPSKDTAILETFNVAIKEFFLEKAMIDNGNDGVRFVEGTIRERLKYEIFAPKDTSKQHLGKQNRWEARLETWRNGKALHGRVGSAPDTLLFIFRELPLMHNPDTIWLYKLM